jgi:hypothetical protein
MFSNFLEYQIVKNNNYSKIINKIINFAKFNGDEICRNVTSELIGKFRQYTQTDR